MSQADTITELEAELAKSQKQESAYSDAIDQMQREVDELQEECVKLKAAAANAPDRPGESYEYDLSFAPVDNMLCSCWRLTDRRGRDPSPRG